MMNNHNNWKKPSSHCGKITNTLSKHQPSHIPPACDKQEQKMLHNCQRIHVYKHNQSQNIAIYVQKILQKHEFSPRLIYNSLFVKTAKTTVTKNRMNNVMYITLLVGLYK